jgi:hypothetical protein
MNIGTIDRYQRTRMYPHTLAALPPPFECPLVTAFFAQHVIAGLTLVRKSKVTLLTTVALVLEYEATCRRPKYRIAARPDESEVRIFVGAESNASMARSAVLAADEWSSSHHAPSETI